MENPEQAEVKISSATVRRLRIEHGWSQDQLAVVSGLGLRTIQRVEAEGTASLETRKSLAAAFAVQLSDLAEAPVTQAHGGAPRPSLARYKVAAGIAIVACIPAMLAAVGVVPAGVVWLGAAPVMVAIAFGLYAGLGWYVTGTGVKRSRARHVVGALFIFGGIFCAMALASPGGRETLESPALAGLLATGIYFVVDYLASRHRRPGNPAR